MIYMSLKCMLVAGVITNEWCGSTACQSVQQAAR